MEREVGVIRVSVQLGLGYNKGWVRVKLGFG